MIPGVLGLAILILHFRFLMHCYKAKRLLTSAGSRQRGCPGMVKEVRLKAQAAQRWLASFMAMAVARKNFPGVFGFHEGFLLILGTILCISRLL